MDFCQKSLAGTVRNATQWLRGCYTSTLESIRWILAYKLNPLRRTGSPALHQAGSPGSAYNSVRYALKSLGVEVESVEIDIQEYQSHMENTNYSPRFSSKSYYGVYFPEKSLEYFLSAKLLELRKDDILIDIASGGSPFPDVARRLFKCKVYKQDLTYPAGIHGDQIGGDAAHIPVPDCFASKLSLNCSFEHLEGNSDTGFIREASRILRPGGKLCILPLYLSNKYSIITNPFVDHTGIVWDKAAKIRYVRGWTGARYGRFYDVKAFESRVLDHCGELSFQMLYVENPEAIDPTCYARFIAIFEKC